MLVCGVLVKTVNNKRPCLCELGHAGGHNPFSPNPYMLPTLPDKVPDVKLFEKFGTVWTDRSTVQRCLWSGTRSRCIYELGHTLPHKEEDITYHAD